jgi:hypothetical protein
MGLVIFSEGKYIDAPKCYGEKFGERDECRDCQSAVIYQCRYKYNDERY